MSIDKDSKPLISIGVTCFNAAKTINRAISSALAQDWPNYELLIVDDCSFDDSVKVIKQTISGIINARLICHKNNLGPAAARNTIMALAKGDFIIFFDDDDESFPNRLRIQYQRLRDYELSNGVNLVACYSSGIKKYPNGYELSVTAIGSRPGIPKGDTISEYLLFNRRQNGTYYGSGTPTCALMARKSTFQIVGGFDSRFRRVEDIDLAIRLAMAGCHFIGCPEILFTQHITEANDKTPQMNLDAELRLVEKYASYLRKKNRYYYARDWFKIRFYHFSRRRLRFFLSLLYFLLRFPLSGTAHLIRSAPSRLYHEKKITKT